MRATPKRSAILPRDGLLRIMARSRPIRAKEALTARECRLFWTSAIRTEVVDRGQRHPTAGGKAASRPESETCEAELATSTTAKGLAVLIQIVDANGGTLFYFCRGLPAEVNLSRCGAGSTSAG